MQNLWLACGERSKHPAGPQSVPRSRAIPPFWVAPGPLTWLRDASPLSPSKRTVRTHAAASMSALPAVACGEPTTPSPKPRAGAPSRTVCRPTLWAPLPLTLPIGAAIPSTWVQESRTPALIPAPARESSSPRTAETAGPSSLAALLPSTVPSATSLSTHPTPIPSMWAPPAAFAGSALSLAAQLATRPRALGSR